MGIVYNMYGTWTIYEVLNEAYWRFKKGNTDLFTAHLWLLWLQMDAFTHGDLPCVQQFDPNKIARHCGG
jgi:hypothetical protein